MNDQTQNTEQLEEDLTPVRPEGMSDEEYQAMLDQQELELIAQRNSANLRAKALAQAKKRANSTANKKKKQSKLTDEERDAIEANYKAFRDALTVYYNPVRDLTETIDEDGNEVTSTNRGMCFYRDGQSTYFYLLTTQIRDVKTGKKTYKSEFKFIPHGGLYPAFSEMLDPNAKIWVRKLMDGGDFNIKKIDDKGDIVVEQYTLTSRLYDKLVNSVNIVDEKTFNMLDLSTAMKPTNVEGDTYEMPILLRALMSSLSGNIMTWNEERQEWDQTKPENMLWLERYWYGVVCADIGNNFSPMPVFYGKGKGGKNAFYDIVLPAMLGAERCYSGVWSTLTSNFNSYKLGKVIAFIDEAPERGDWDIVKNQSGSTNELIKIKYGAEFLADICCKLAFGSNQELYPFPVEEGHQMMRVSPMKQVPNNTFAEVAYKFLEHKHGAGWCVKRLAEAGIVLTDQTPFNIGDALLRNPLNLEWCGPEACQQALNYLHQQYAPAGAHYVLEPLRGQDWQEIVEQKQDTIAIIVEFIIAHNPDIITTNELYECYKTLNEDRNGASQQSRAIRTKQNFNSLIKPMLEQRGWHYKRNNIIGNGARTDIYHKEPVVHGAFARYQEDFDEYIIPGIGNRKGQLKWPVQTATSTFETAGFVFKEPKANVEPDGLTATPTEANSWIKQQMAKHRKTNEL